MGAGRWDLAAERARAAVAPATEMLHFLHRPLPLPVSFPRGWTVPHWRCIPHAASYAYNTRAKVAIVLLAIKMSSVVRSLQLMNARCAVSGCPSLESIAAAGSSSHEKDQ